MQRFNKSRVVLVPELSFGDDILSWSILSINLVSDCFVFLCISLQLLYCLYPYHLIIISLSVPCKADWPAMFYSQNIFNKLPQCLWQQPFTSATFQFKCFNHKSISTSMILWDPSEPACVVLVFLFLKVMQKIGKCFSSHFSFLPPPPHPTKKKKPVTKQLQLPLTCYITGEGQMEQFILDAFGPTAQLSAPTGLRTGCRGGEDRRVRRRLKI